MVTFSASLYRRAASGCVALALVLMATATAFAQEYEARVDRHRITTQEVVRLIIETEGDARSVLPPESDDFRVISRSTQTSMSFVNGHMTRQLTATFQLAPTRAGTLETGAASVLLNTGRRHQTPSFTITVEDKGGPAGAQPPMPSAASGSQMPQVPPPYAKPPPPAPTSRAARPFGQLPPMPPPGSDALISVDAAVVDGKVPFVLPYVASRSATRGEPFLVEYLYYAPLLGLGFEASNLSEPAFKDSWFHDITEARAQAGVRLGNVRINGHLYAVHLVRSYLVVPLSEGTFDVAPIGLVVEGRSVTRRTGTLALWSPALTVDIAALPATAPDVQAPSVGRFDFDVRVSPLEAQVGETLQIQLTIQGVGVLSQMQMPDVPVPATLRAFPPTDTSSSDYDTSAWIESTLSRTLSFQATQEGDIEIPQIIFHWFDPWERAWKQQTSEPQTIRIQGVNAAIDIDQTRDQDAGPTRVSWQSALPKPDDHSDAVGWTARLRQKDEPWAGTLWFYLLMALPLVLCVAWIGTDRWRAHRRLTAPARAENSAGRDALRALRALRFHKQEDFSQLSRIARSYLAAQGQASAQGATIDELTRLVRVSRPAARASTLVEAVEQAESARFGGGDADTFAQIQRTIDAWIVEDQKEAIA